MPAPTAAERVEHIDAGFRRLLSESNYPPPVIFVCTQDLPAERVEQFRKEWQQMMMGRVVSSRPVMLNIEPESSIEFEPCPTGAGELISLLTLDYHACLS